jgi:hypothetical protein
VVVLAFIHNIEEKDYLDQGNSNLKN